MSSSLSFRSFPLGTKIWQAVEEAGYARPTPIQAAAIPLILQGRDLIGIAQTGTGKTAAFTLPILAKLCPEGNIPARSGTRALILSPTRELAAQIEQNARTYGKHLPLRIASVHGGVRERPQVAALRSGVDLVVACPGRLLDLLEQQHGNLARLEFLVFDEADRMLDMGFLPSIRQIMRWVSRKRQTLLFSATCSPEIETLARDFLSAPQIVRIGRRADPAQAVVQSVYEVAREQKAELLCRLLQAEELRSVLVFSRTKHGADRIGRVLERAGIPTATMHADRSQGQRTRALEAFKAGAVRVLVATDIAARGIDVDGISHVINYDFPATPEDYVHRIGRTGRAEATGDAISFVAREELGALRALERLLGRTIERKQIAGFAPEGCSGGSSAGGQQSPASPEHRPAGRSRASRADRRGRYRSGGRGSSRHEPRSFRPA
ncbi:ATP-dependent RNA helicase RhlE [Methylacidimicrobium sp. AP8]|uniref:DEAD/DEAH box helicase n=1 Tax=Methylacidimicrobium sp. AP8 TaxID=2730359 RepID=UPI0018C14337|nr:DEAD/DEAH box helicase [Methylacidimicrobium sp. AP8]CAB4244011.1 ATP-dependent RNA helicase RhlE [Methylacidimicrobium sp. AP8]